MYQNDPNQSVELHNPGEQVSKTNQRNKDKANQEQGEPKNYPNQHESQVTQPWTN